jgi:hypothetical protein
MQNIDELTPAESALLVILMSEAGDISNKDLDTRFSLTLTGESRRKLNRLGYVESWKEGRGYSHRLADAGWARCQRPLNFASPRARALGAALASLLSAVHRDLERTNRSLALAFAPMPTDQPKKPDTRTAGLISRIREAYGQIATGPGAWVGIADIRRKLADASPTDLDAALRELERASDVNIVPQSNQKALTDDDRRSAVTIGGQRKHYLAIGV